MKTILAVLLLTAVPSAGRAATIQLGDEFETSTTHFVVTDIKECDKKSKSAQSAYDLTMEEVLELEFADPMADGAVLSCKTKETVEFAIGIAQLSIATGSVIAMCSAIVAPFGAVIAGAAVAVQFVDFALDKVDCYDEASEEKNRALIKQQICEAMIANGLECDPNKV